MGNLIYTEYVFDAESFEEISSVSHEYGGEISQCGGGSGGGSSTTNTVDYAYNARMATLSEEQQRWAKEYFEVWQQYQKPYEIAQAKVNMEMLPMETELYKQQLVSANALMPQQHAASEKFLKQATQGVDVNERMALAAADQADAFKDSTAQTARANARMGVNPNSGRFQGMNATNALRQATAVAGAKTQARVGAEQENFDRLKDASQFNVNSIVQGIGFSAE